jgi:hypothetical protein
MAISAFGAGVFTPTDFADRLRLFGSTLDKPISRGIRAGLSYARNVAIKRFSERGLGRTIFGLDRSGVRPLVKIMPVRRRGDSWTGGLQVKGLMALQEVGGSTKPHIIRPSKAKVLRFEAGRAGGNFIGPMQPGPQRLSEGASSFIGPGRPIFAKEVRHPGGKLPAFPVIGDAMATAATFTQKRIDLEVDRHLAELGLGGRVGAILGQGA